MNRFSLNRNYGIIHFDKWIFYCRTALWLALLLAAGNQTLFAQAINLLCLENGARIIQYSSSAWDDFETYLDSDADFETSLYCSARKIPFPHYFIYELALTAEISTLEFDTRGEELAFPGVSAKDIHVYSMQTDEPSFTLIQSFHLEKNLGAQIFSVTPFKCRRLKIEIVSNHGEPELTQLARVKAFGDFLPFSNDDSITGIWSTTFGELKIYRTQPFVTGCYEEGTLQGTFQNRICSFYWTETEQGGVASVILNEEGDRLLGFWGAEDQGYESWAGEKISSKIITCPEEPLAQQLDAIGQAMLFSARFMSPQDTSSHASKEILAGAVHYLNENPDKKLAIEGFTTSDSAAAEKALAELGALRIKNFLVARGIADDRLSIKGISEARPLADYQTATGKMLSHRIRLKVQ